MVVKRRPFGWIIAVRPLRPPFGVWRQPFCTASRLPDGEHHPERQALCRTTGII
jgi:hypothetical protein